MAIETLGKEQESALIERASKGDKDAYRRLVEKYQARVYSLVFNIVHNREDAEDLAQETFVKVYLCLKDFKGDAAFYTWLYRIAYNMAIDFKRKVARKGGIAEEYQDESMGLKAESSGAALGHVAGPQEMLNRKETAHALHKVFGELSDEHRSAISLREVDGLSYDEIAEISGVSKGTVMSRLHYARKRLQQALKEFAPDFFAGGGSNEDTENEQENSLKQPARFTSGRLIGTKRALPAGVAGGICREVGE